MSGIHDIHWVFRQQAEYREYRTAGITTWCAFNAYVVSVFVAKN